MKNLVFASWVHLLKFFEDSLSPPSANVTFSNKEVALEILLSCNSIIVDGDIDTG